MKPPPGKLIALFLPALLLYACASYRETLTTNERVVLGLLLESTDGTYWGMAGAALIERAGAAGFEVLARTAAGGGGEVRERQARELVQAGASLLVAIPSTGESSDSPPARLPSLPVPVIACGGPIPGFELSLVVASDPEEAGYLQARTVRERMTGGGMVLLGGPEDDSGASLLREGQLRALAEWEETRGEKTELAADLRLNSPGAGDSRLALSDLLDRSVRGRKAVGAVIAFDDEAAAGAAAAVGEKNLSGRVLIAGRGASLAACRRIIAGEQLLTLYTPPGELAAAAVRSAIRLFRGMEPGEIAESLGRAPGGFEPEGREVPVVLLPPVLVTRSTMVETVILDGLYTIDAIYGAAGQ